MNLQVKDRSTADKAEKLTQKYYVRMKQMPQSEDFISETKDEAAQRQRSKDTQTYSEALHKLFKAATSQPDNDQSAHGSDEDPSRDTTADQFLRDSQVLFTETDVTLSSCLVGSPGSLETLVNEEVQRAHQPPDSSRSSTLVLAEVYQEMMTIYEQLRSERQSQQEWERELQERERRLKKQEEAFGKLAGLEMLHTRFVAAEEKHRQELSQLQDLLREKNKENRRLKSSFDIIKDQNDKMKKQIKEISEHNQRLESQGRRVQARLDNLQRKLEHSASSRGCEKMSVKSIDSVKPSKKEKTASTGKSSNKACFSHTSAKLLTLLLDWVLDGQIFSSAAGNKGKVVDQCLPPEVLLNERCLKVLPLLADQLHRTPSSEDELLINLLRLIHSVLRHMDSSTPHVALSATLRRIGEQVSKASAPLTTSEDPDFHKSCSEAAAGPCRRWPLYRSPCPHTCILSILIILRTVTQADVVAQALDSLHTELISEEKRGLFIHYGGVCVLLSMLQAGRGGLHSLIDILMQLTEQSRYLNAFLESCGHEEFFYTVSKLLKNPRLELPWLEKLSILLQKLSGVRRNRRLFEISSLHLQIQELYHKTNHTHTFLCLNLRSILHNLQ